jgi:histidinol phosphatase-like PHP family hydrolase
MGTVRIQPLLCELHAHTTWSDGEMSPRELIDLYGRAGFDVLAITDHTVREPEAGHVHVSITSATSPRSSSRQPVRASATGCW